ncbi:hypothetical protein LCGC14_1744380, partial [marine sediment metagenome]
MNTNTDRPSPDFNAIMDLSDVPRDPVITVRSGRPVEKIKMRTDVDLSKSKPVIAQVISE